MIDIETVMLVLFIVCGLLFVVVIPWLFLYRASKKSEPERRPPDWSELSALRFFQRIADGDLRDIIRKDCGLCGNAATAETFRGQITGAIKRHQETWIHYSDDPSYPIPSQVKGKTAEEDYDSPRHKWQGRRLTLRRSLAAHIARKLKEEKKIK
jgi:hypothetical protein